MFNPITFPELKHESQFNQLTINAGGYWTTVADTVTARVPVVVLGITCHFDVYDSVNGNYPQAFNGLVRVTPMAKTGSAQFTPTVGSNSRILSAGTSNSQTFILLPLSFTMEDGDTFALDLALRLLSVAGANGVTCQIYTSIYFRYRKAFERF